MSDKEAISVEDTLKRALEAFIVAGFGNSTDFSLQSKAHGLAVGALAQSHSDVKQEQGEPVACCNGYYKQGYEAGFAGQEHYIHALQEALAKKEQSAEHVGEPVAKDDADIYAFWARNKESEQGEPFGWYDMEHGEIRDVEWNRQKPTYEGVWRPLYTTPQQRKPLTDDEIYEMYNEPRSDAEMIAFARAIEAAHGIKE